LKTIGSAVLLVLGIGMSGCTPPAGDGAAVPPSPDSSQPLPSARPAVLGQEVALMPAQATRLQGEPLEVSFLRVVEDSRCPRGAQCVRAGEAKVELMLTVQDRVENGILSTAAEPRSVSLGPYVVHLVRLDPLPTTEGPPSRYTATLRVEKP
jgi:hypothetical protein